MMSRILKGIKRITGISKPSESSFTKDFLNPNYNIGDFTYGIPTVFDYGEGKTLTIGKFCSIASDVKIFLGGNHRTDWVSTFPFNAFSHHFPEAKHISGHPASKGDVIIGNDVWIGHSATILSGNTIGNGAVVGGRSVVTKNIGAYEIWAGNPARFVKKRFSDHEISALENLAWWNWNIDKIRQNIYLISSGNVSDLLSKSENI